MFLETLLRNTLTDLLDPSVLDLENESHGHNVPENSETHFRLVIVSKMFEGLSRVRRHQLVYKALNEYMHGEIHALTMKTLTPEEYKNSQK